MIENKNGEIFVTKDIKLINESKNDRNIMLAVFKICSNCRCFFSIPNARIDFSQMCLKNEIVNVLNLVRGMNNKEFDDAFLGDSTIKPACFIGKKPEMIL